MARPRTPTNILEARGAFEKDPQRRRDGEPQPTGELGDPPDWLDENQTAAWHELAEMAPPGVLTNSDRILVELAARLIVFVRLTPYKGNAALYDKLISCLGRMGMTPSDRSKINLAAPPKGPNPFDVPRDN